MSLIMSFKPVKALRSPQQLAWIALLYNCYQLLGVNIFRVSRCGIKFSSTCWGKGKRGASAPTLRSWWGASLRRRLWKLGTRCQNLISNPCSCSSRTSAAAKTLTVFTVCPVTVPDTQSAQQFIGYQYHMNLQYFWFLRCFTVRIVSV